MPTKDPKIMSNLTQRLFKVNDQPLIIPPRFDELWEAIFTRRYNRVNTIAPTQDGKSLSIASAVVPVCASTSEKFTILAPSEKKADIIMSYIRDFSTQHHFISSQLELDKTDTLERLKRERSKRHLTFKKGGGVQTLTLDARNSKRCIEAAMGFGSKNIIEDESGLIEDQLHSTVMRMLGGYPYKDTMLIKIGNPFYRNHFFKSSLNGNYKQIRHAYQESISDSEAGYHGFDPLFIEEMRNEAFFDVYYDCLFPPEDIVDMYGFRQLLLSEEIKQGDIAPIGVPHLGCDIGGGGDLNTYVKRWDNCAKIAGHNRSRDTMINVTEIERFLAEDAELKPENVTVDDIGIGRGVVDRLKEKQIYVSGVAVGGKPRDVKRYANIKAEICWRGKQWLAAGNLLAPASYWEQLLWFKFKINSDRLMAMESKEDLKKRTGKSPDFGDAFFLTFYQKPRAGIITL